MMAEAVVPAEGTVVNPGRASTRLTTASAHHRRTKLLMTGSQNLLLQIDARDAILVCRGVAAANKPKRARGCVGVWAD
jgi:hypothetical protein